MILWEQSHVRIQVTQSLLFKNLVTWIVNELPIGVTHGSYEIVDAWTRLSTEERRVVLEQQKLIYSEKDEIIKILKGVEAVEPVF